MKRSTLLRTLIIAGSVATGACHAELLVVVSESARIWKGAQLLAEVPQGTELVAKTFQSNWFCVQAEVGGAPAKDGWIRAKDVDFKPVQDAQAKRHELWIKATALGASNMEFSRRLQQYGSYDLKALYPSAVDFGYGKWIDLPDAGIVKQVHFSRDGRAKIRCLNETTQRVDPDIVVWVLNRDGVVLWGAKGSWPMGSVEPGSTQEKDTSYRFAIDKSLAFSKWARLGWDLRPRYILAVGSKRSYDKLMERTMDEVRRLSADPDHGPGEDRSAKSQSGAARHAPSIGFVRDEFAAREIARIAMGHLVSADDFRRKKFSDAVLKDGVWTVRYWEAKLRVNLPLVIQIRQKTGAIIKYEDPNA